MPQHTFNIIGRIFAYGIVGGMGVFGLYTTGKILGFSPIRGILRFAHLILGGVISSWR